MFKSITATVLVQTKVLNMVEQIGRDISGVQTMVEQSWTNDLRGLGPGGAWVQYWGGGCVLVGPACVNG